MKIIYQYKMQRATEMVTILFIEKRLTMGTEWLSVMKKDLF